MQNMDKAEASGSSSGSCRVPEAPECAVAAVLTGAGAGAEGVGVRVRILSIVMLGPSGPDVSPM